MFKGFEDYNFFEPMKLNKQQLDSAIEQAGIMKNYFAMTETYLTMVRNNLDFWHSFYIDPNKDKKS